MPDISNIQLNGNSVTVDKIILDGVTLPLEGGGGGGDTAMKENVQGTLTSYTIPNDVTSIRDYAFAHLNSLTSVTIPNSVTEICQYAFQSCSGLTSVTIPNSVTEIGNNAFQSCSGLTSVTIPNSVTEIGNNTFTLCSSLSSIIISNGVTKIGNSAFTQCSSLSSIIIPNSVTTMGSSVFYNCSSLTSVTISNSLAKLSNGLFTSCISLASVTIPDSVTEIEGAAFNACTLLQAITIPSNVTTIGNSVFQGCISLKYVKFSSLTPPSLSSYSGQLEYMQDILVPQSAVSAYVTAFPLWENRIFADTHTHDYSVTELRYSNQTGSTPFTQLSDTTLNISNVYLTNLKRVYIGNNVTTVENGTFRNSYATSILIPEVNSLETIENYAFFSSNVVGNLYLPNVTEIGSNAFYSNHNMLSVTIGDKITLIGQQAFGNCEKLTSVTCLATTPPTLNTAAFISTNDCPIYVPAESVEAYKAASGWKVYASRIQAIPAE